MGACESGWTDCDQQDTNGCEADTDTDTSNCGTCGTTCTNDHGTTSCSSGSCAPSCQTGWDNCNDDPNDGCETEVKSLSNCGSCGTTCSLANATETCSTGVCEVDSCESGFCNADGDPNNGCEFEVDPSTTRTCTNSSVGDLGKVSGDSGSDSVSTSAVGERWFAVRVTEDDTSIFCWPLGIEIKLASPSGDDYDMQIYCSSCTNEQAFSARSSSPEYAYLQWGDACDGSSSARTIYIRVLAYSVSSCADYTLTVNGYVFHYDPDACGAPCGKCAIK